MYDFLDDIEGIIFDLDGTILDSLELWKNIDIMFFQEKGLALPSNYGQETAHMGFLRMAEYTKERFHMEDSVEQILTRWNELAVQEYQKSIELKDGAKEFLFEVKRRNIKTAIATAGEPSLFIPCLERNGISHCFDSFTTVNEVNKTKDSPDIYLECIKKMGVSKEKTILFEDIACGLNAAHSVGIQTICVLDPHNIKDNEKINFDCKYIKSFNELK